MTMYRACKWWFTIEPVEVDRETDCYLFIGGRRIAKESTGESYFRTREEAKNWLYQCQSNEVDALEVRLRSARDGLHKILCL